MINLDNSIISKCIVHKVGNSYTGDKSVYSNSEMNLSDQEMIELKKIFTKNFKAPLQSNKFAHSIDLDQNVIFKIIEDMFDSESNYLKNTKNITKYLYEQTTHYSIKSGEVFILTFEDAINGDIISNAIGIFKVENPTNFIKSSYDQNSINIYFEKGIIGRNIEKGCIVFNNDYQDEFIVYSYEKNNTDTNYWNKNFLSIKKREDNFNTTSAILETYRDFVLNDLPNDTISKIRKIDLVNKSIDFVSGSVGNINVNDFIENNLPDKNSQNQYRNYLENYKESNELLIHDNFEPSNSAIKYQQKKFSRVIKLDKNFHIYVHSNENLIENGTDENGRKYYKLFYENEL